MKKTIAVLFALITILALGPRLAFAEPIELDLKIVKLVLPFQNVNTAYLYDIHYQKSLIGLETPVLVSNSGRTRLVIGGAKEEGENDIDAYIGGDTAISEKYFGQRFQAGGWISIDTEIGGGFKDKLRGGLKASIKLW